MDFSEHSGIGSSAAAAANRGEVDTPDYYGKRRPQKIASCKMPAARPCDEIPPDLCRRCGLRGKHEDYEQCIRALLDLLAHI